MPKYKFSMRIDSIFVPENRRSEDSRVENRFLIQLIAPSTIDHPTATFSIQSPDGKAVPSNVIQKAVPFGLIFKNQDFEPIFEEPLIMRIHFFQDTRRNWFDQVSGRFVELALDAVLGGASVLDVKLNKLIDLKESLRLSDETYSQKLGVIERSFEADELAQQSPAEQVFELEAPEDVEHWAFIKPGDTRVERVTVVEKGDVTARVEATLVMRRV